MLLALMLMASSPTTPSPDTVTFTPRAESATTDSAVPLDWSGPAARRPGADASVQEFDPGVSLFGPAAMCVSIPGQPAPECATKPNDGLQVTSDIFEGSDNPDSTCQSVETTRVGADGKPVRMFATVCGDEAESWAYRQRSTPASRGNPTRPTNRNVGPNDINARARSPR
jgi:hypothetical protein